MVWAHVGNVSGEGPGSLCVVQTAVLGHGLLEEKSQATWKRSELAKRVLWGFLQAFLPFVFSGHILLLSLSPEVGLASHSGGGGE